MPNSNLPTIHLAIADDHIMVRQGLCLLISNYPRFKIDFDANDGNELIKLLSQGERLPDICILDINMPNKNGWDTFTEIRLRWPEIKILFLTMLNDKHVIERMIKIGANGYLAKNFSYEELVDSLHKIYRLGSYFPPAAMREVYSCMSAHSNIKPNKKELQFLSYCCEESSYKEIATKMSLSTRTVEGYRDSLFEKLNIKSRVGLAMYALKCGIVSVFEG